MNGICQDVRYAVRGLRQNPGFAAAAVATIALAIGATTAMFTIVNGVLLRDLPYPEPDRLVRLYEVDASRPLDRGLLSLPDLDDWQARSGAFAAAAGYTVLPQVLQNVGEPQELPAAYVTESFFGVLGAPMLLGRALDADDVVRASRNVVISNTLWRSAFGADERALGMSVASSLPTTWLVRTAGDPALLARAVEEELRLATGLPVTEVRTMEQLVSLSVSRQRLHSLLMSVFGAAALLLATVGIYGVVAYSAQQRTHELGIRLALGAEPRRLKALVLRQGFALIGVGVGAGCLAAFYLATLLASVLFGVEPHDGAVFAAVPTLLSVVALTAVWSVARRVSGIDPLTALRHD